MLINMNNSVGNNNMYIMCIYIVYVCINIFNIILIIFFIHMLLLH